MIFDLAALWLIVWLIKNATMDISYAINGKPNPRYEIKKAKARAAGQAAPVQPRYGSRDWLADLLSDGLQAQTEWRRRKAAEKRAQRETVDGEEADELDELEPGDDTTEPVVHDGEPAFTPETERRWAWTCKHDGCPGKGFAFPTQAEAQAAAAEHLRRVHSGQPDAGAQVTGDDPQTSGAGDSGAPEPGQQPTPRPASPPDSGPTAKVIPFPFPNNSQEEPVSTDVNSEVIGLDQSIGYARNLAAFAGEHGQAGNEGYIGHLTQSKVTGDGLSTAHEMQTKFTEAAEAAEAHALELEKQKAVQEAYDNNPDAGDKSFQQEGR
jgi:hypothetical protein